MKVVVFLGIAMGKTNLTLEVPSAASKHSALEIVIKYVIFIIIGTICYIILENIYHRKFHDYHEIKSINKFNKIELIIFFVIFLILFSWNKKKWNKVTST